MIGLFGSNGLVGSHVDFADFKFNRESCDLHNLDKVTECISENNIDTIVNCAAYQKNYKTMSQNQADHFQQNTSINLNVYKAGQLCEVKKIISISSVNAIQRVDIKTEDDLWKNEPRDFCYAESHKNRVLHILSKLYYEQYGIKCITPLLSNTYGLNIKKRNNGAIPILIDKFMESIKNKTDVKLTGDGKASRDFVYAKDVNRILNLLVLDDFPYVNPFIISSGECVSIKEIVEIIIDHLNYKGNVIWSGDKNRETDTKICSNELFKSYFPNFKFTSIEDGVKETINYFMENENV